MQDRPTEYFGNLGFSGQGHATEKTKQPKRGLAEPYGSNPWNFSHNTFIPSPEQDWRMVKYPDGSYREIVMTDGHGKRLHGN